MLNVVSVKGGPFLGEEKIETAYSLLLQGLEVFTKELDVPFLEGYLENTASLLEGEVSKNVIFSKDSQRKALKLIYEKIVNLHLTAEEKRKVSQLLLLKGAKTDHLSANHQLTPDAIGYLFVFLIQQFFPQANQLRLLDPTVGLGNLLATVELALKTAGKEITSIGVENDDLLVEIAAVNAEWFQQNAKFFHQDALQGLLLDPVDVVLSDLPIGYYPNDEKAKNFEVGKNVLSGHTYAHHLIMETSFNYLKPGGFGFYLVPTKLFESEQAQHFTKWLQDKALLQGMIALPPSLFANAASQKSILILQKPGENVQQAKEVLLVQLGSLKKTDQVEKFFQQFATWHQANFR